MKRIALLSILFAVSLAASGRAQAALSVTDATGEVFTLDRPPRRIVSLVPTITENLYLLGAEDAVIGVTTFCIYPPRAQKKEKIGTFLKPNVEKVVSLSPDIVFGTKEGQNRALIMKMRKMGLEVFVFGESRNFDDISRDFILLGRIVGKEDKAEAIIRKTERRIGAVTERLKPVDKTRTFIQLDTRPIISVGSDTFVDELVELAGGRNITRSSRIRYPRYSTEEVIREDPEAIIIISMGSGAMAEKARWERYGALSAVKNKRVYVVEAHKVSSAVPSEFADGLEALARLLHPEIWQGKGDR